MGDKGAMAAVAWQASQAMCTRTGWAWGSRIVAVRWHHAQSRPLGMVLVVAALAGGDRVCRMESDLFGVAVGALDIRVLLVREAHRPMTRRLAGGRDRDIHLDGRRHLARLMAGRAVATLGGLVVADLAATRRCEGELLRRTC